MMNESHWEKIVINYRMPVTKSERKVSVKFKFNNKDLEAYLTAKEARRLSYLLQEIANEIDAENLD